MPTQTLRAYTPHTLLLLTAALGLATVNAPQTPPAPTTQPAVISNTSNEIQTQPAVYRDRSYMHAEASTRSLTDVLAQARIRFEHMRRNQTDRPGADADDTSVQAPTATAFDLDQQRAARRLDASRFAPAAPRFSRPHADVPTLAAAESPATPDALPQREYVILEYGDIDGTEPVSSRADQVETARPTLTTDAQAAADFPFAEPTRAINTPSITAQTYNPAAAPDAAPQPGAASTEPAPPTAASIQPAFASQPAVTATQTVAVQPASASASQTLARQSEPQTPATTTDQPEATPVIHSRRRLLDRTLTDAFTQHNLPPADNITPKSPTQAQAQTQQRPTTAIKTEPPAVASPVVTADVPRSTNSALKQTQSKLTQNNPKQTTPVAQTTAVNKNTTSQPLVVLLDDYDKVAADRVNAIDNALKEINQATRQAGIAVELTLTTDPAADHNILLREDDNDLLNGKLGLAQSAAVLDDHGNEFRLGQESSALGGQAIASINKAISWFTGDDTFGIQKDQYDYQTAVTHELLHLLGLDDDFGGNQSLVMHGYLSPGQTRRAIEAAEKAELTSRYSRNNIWSTNARSNSKSARTSRQGLTYRSEALTAAPVPEPAGALLIGAGVFAWVGAGRR